MCVIIDVILDKKNFLNYDNVIGKKEEEDPHEK